MAISLGSLLVPDLNGQIDQKRILFIHNIFASMQDVATDARGIGAR